MYIRTPAAWSLDAPPSAKPTVKPYESPFNTGGDIGEKDSQKLFTVLSGPSPYQLYIRQVMASKAASTLPKNVLRIVSSPKEVSEQRDNVSTYEIGGGLPCPEDEGHVSATPDVIPRRISL